MLSKLLNQVIIVGKTKISKRDTLLFLCPSVFIHQDKSEWKIIRCHLFNEHLLSTYYIPDSMLGQV